jgi:hypothetical protein
LASARPGSSPSRRSGHAAPCRRSSRIVMVRADPGQFRPVVNRQGRGWHWLSACDIPSVILSLVHALHPLVGNIRLFGLLLRLVRAGDCRVGHDPAAHGCLAALRVLDSRERLTCEEGHFGGLWLSSAGARPALAERNDHVSRIVKCDEIPVEIRTSLRHDLLCSHGRTLSSSHGRVPAVGARTNDTS